MLAHADGGDAGEVRPAGTEEEQEQRWIIVRNAARCRHCGSLVESRDVMRATYCRCKKISVRGGHLLMGRGWTKEMEDIIELGVMIPVIDEEPEQESDSE